MQKAKLIHLDDMNKDFSSRGYDLEKVWKLNEVERKNIIKKYTLCYAQTTSNKRFNLKVHNKICAEKLERFFKWLDNSKYKKFLKK